jgi:hypothetical protein
MKWKNFTLTLYAKIKVKKRQNDRNEEKIDFIKLSRFNGMLI